MNTSTQLRVYVALAVLFALGPFVAGMIRMLGPAHDARLMWMAVASYAALLAVAWLVPAAREGRMSPVARGVTTFGLAVLLVTATGFALGARAVPGVLMIAIVMGAFAGASNYFRGRLKTQRAM